MFDDMSLVTMLCSSTAAAVEAMNSLTPAIAALIAVSEPTTSLATPFSASISRDRVGGVLGLVGEVLDLGGDDGKAAAGLAGARRLDGGVQRQQVDLSGDVADQFDDAAHGLRRCVELLSLPVRGFDPRPVALAVSRDLAMVSEISRIEALISSLPAATDSIRPARVLGLLAAIACAVMSVAYFTTLKGLPLRSRIGL